jgi:hypothetical protein
MKHGIDTFHVAFIILFCVARQFSSLTQLKQRGMLCYLAGYGYLTMKRFIFTMTAYPGKTQTTLGQLCVALWDSQSRPDVMQTGFEPGTVVTPLALRCSSLDRCATQELVAQQQMEKTYTSRVIQFNNNLHFNLTSQTTRGFSSLFLNQGPYKITYLAEVGYVA